MNMIILVLLVVLGYTYFGGPKVPKILKDYKEMLLGVFVGILLHQFFGIRVEDNIEGLPGDTIEIQEYNPASEDLPVGQTIEDWRENTIADLQGRYDNYDSDNDSGEVFKAEDGAVPSQGGKKYTCGDIGQNSNYQMVSVPVSDRSGGQKMVQVCLDSQDPYNLDAMVPIRIQTLADYGNKDSLGRFAVRWGDKYIVSCDAVSSITSANPQGQMSRVEGSDDDGPSFYCE